MHQYTLTKEQLVQFRLLYGRRSDRELARHFGVSLAYIADTANRFALGKDKATFPGRRMPRWTTSEIERLIELYPDHDNLDIARRIGRTVKSVISKAHKLGLRKTADRLVEMGKENVSLRADRQKS